MMVNLYTEWQLLLPHRILTDIVLNWTEQQNDGHVTVEVCREGNFRDQRSIERLGEQKHSPVNCFVTKQDRVQLFSGGGYSVAISAILPAAEFLVFLSLCVILFRFNSFYCRPWRKFRIRKLLPCLIYCNIILKEVRVSFQNLTFSPFVIFKFQPTLSNHCRSNVVIK